MILLAAAAWAGDTWSVPDEVRAEQLRAALAVEWPGAGADVVVGRAEEGLLGPSWDGLELVLVRGDEVLRAPADDASEAVLLVRTWTLTTDPLPPESFVPPPPPAPPPPPPAPAPPPPPRLWAWSTGVGTRVSATGPTSGGRVVGSLERRAFAGELAVGFGVAELSVAERGPADLLVLTPAAGLRLGGSRAAFRAAVGPEARWTQRLVGPWEGESALRDGFDAGAVGTAGGDVRVGRFELVALGFGAATALGDFDAGVVADLRVRVR